MDSVKQREIEEKVSSALNEPTSSDDGNRGEENRQATVEPSPNSENPGSDGLDQPWFSPGLRFKCTGCGKCCTGSPGYVYLSNTDLEQLATHFSMRPEEFAKKYVRLVDNQYALIDKKGSHDCIFLKENKCTVYDARPTQCRTFPWWLYHLRGKQLSPKEALAKIKD